MNTRRTHRALILGSFAFAMILILQSGHIDGVLANFESDVSHEATPDGVTSAGLEINSVQQTANKVTWTQPVQEIQKSTATDQSNDPIATSGVELIGWCEEPVSVYCRGYLMAVADTLKDHRRLCFPANTTVGEMRRTFLLWTKKNPFRMNERASVLLDHAYRGAWPCA